MATAQAVERATGCRVRIQPGREVRPWDADEAVAARAKAQALLGWTARHSLQDGIAPTAAWMSERLDLYR